MDQRPATKVFPLTSVLLIPAGFALGVLGGLLLTNNQLDSPLPDGVDAVAVPVTILTERIPTPQPAIVGSPPAPAQPVLPVAPPAPTVEVPPPPPATYTIVPGDTLSAIATRLGVDVQDLIEANNITDPGSIAVGQVLVLP